MQHALLRAFFLEGAFAASRHRKTKGVGCRGVQVRSAMRGLVVQALAGFFEMFYGVT